MQSAVPEWLAPVRHHADAAGAHDDLANWLRAIKQCEPPG